MKKSLLFFFLLFISFQLSANENFFPNFILMDTTYLSVSICEGGEYEWNGNIYSQAGEYEEIYVNTMGEDSVIVLELEVLENDTTEFVEVICSSEENPFTGEIITHYGSSDDDSLEIVDNEVLINAVGCDSTVIYTLIVYPEMGLIGEGYVPYGYIVNGMPLYETTSITTFDTTSFGCLSWSSYTYIVEPNSTTELEKEINLKLFPSPFSELLSVEFEMPISADVSISLYNPAGQKIDDFLTKERLPHSAHSFTFEVEEMPPGIYFLKFEMDGEFFMKKVLKN